MTWDHPVPLGRWAALQDEAFWVPLAGIISRVVGDLGLKPEVAGTLITNGMAAGEIGHKAAKGDDWIVAPRGAELLRLSGFNYGTMIDWRAGTMCWPGTAPNQILVFWPDVERAAQQENTSPIIEHEDTLALAPPARGRPSKARDAIVADMRKAIASGILTNREMAKMKQESLAEMFGTSRKTARAAREAVLQIAPKSSVT